MSQGLRSKSEGASDKPAKDFFVRVRESLDLVESAGNDGWRAIFEILLDQLVDDPSLSSQQKLRHLTSVRQLAADATRALVPEIPVVATKLWLDRPARQRDPIEFVRENYGHLLGLGLTQADIRRLDPQLYAALQNWKHRKGWPIDFYLPSRKEQNDEQIAALTNEDVKENRRLTEALRNRARKIG